MIKPVDDSLDAKFRTLANSAPVLLWMAGIDGMCEFFNDRWLKFTGRTMEEELGNGWAEGVHPEDFQRCMHTYLEAFVERKSFEMEYRLRRADGDYRWIYDLGVPHYEPDGRFAGYIGSCVDITEQRESREILRRAGDELRQTIHAAPTGIIMVDERGTMVMTNSLVQSAFGYTREELQGQPVEMLIPQRLHESHRRLRRGYLEAPKARPMGQDRPLYGRRKDGSEMPVEIGLSPLRTSQGNFVLASVVDITQRRKAERDREKLTERLRQVNAELNATLREREALLQEVHHRVKNNLQLISSLINMQVRRLTFDGSRDALEQCGARVRTMALIHEKLHHSGTDSRVPFPEYAQALVSDVVRASGVTQDVRLDLQVEEVELSLEQAVPCGLILNELVSNSLKHAFPDERPGVITLRLNQKGKYVTFSVRDDGIGLAKNRETVAKKTLGLQLVSTFVEQLRGRMEIDRTSGTTISVMFEKKEHLGDSGGGRPAERKERHVTHLDRRG